MRLSNGFIIDKEKTFGELKFTAVRDVFLQNEDGTPSTHDIVNIGLHFFLKNVRPYAASCSEA